MSTYLLLLSVTVIFGIARFIVPVEGAISHDDIFKDLAHIWVGILIGIAWYREPKTVHGWYERLMWWALPIGITALEVIAFFVRKVSP